MFNLGIDLGTTNSAMAVVEEDAESADLVENFNGERTTPSVVQILKDQEVVVGGDALAEQVRYPDRTLTRTKRDMGTDESYDIDGTAYPPERIAGYIIQKLTEDAESRYDKTVDGAVITVPYYFGAAARKATEDAAEKFADLPVYRLMNEPTAACYAYGYEEGDEETLLVYDLGGGTFDATLVEVTEDEIVAQTANGDKELGGENFDDELYEHVRGDLLERGAPDPDADSRKRSELRRKVKQTKETLSTKNEAAVVYQDDDFYDIEIMQEEFHGLTADLVERTIDIIDELFADSEYEPKDVDNVLMVGGSTRMPHVQDAVEEYFGLEPSTDTNPDEVVAKGAALEAAQYDPEKDVDDLPTRRFTDVLSHSLGVETHNPNGPNRFDPILEKDAELPDRNTKPYGNPHDTTADLQVNVIQGEEEIAQHEDNENLGDFVLHDVPDDVKLHCEFFIREDATLEVTAEAEERDIQGEIEITEGIGLTEQEAEQIKAETADFESKALKKRAGGET